MEFQSGAVRPVGSIEDGWGIIKNDYWTFFFMTTVAIILLVVAAMALGFINNLIALGISGALGVATANAGDAGKVSAAIIPNVISMFISIFTNIIIVTASGALFCGIYQALSNKVSGGVADFNDLFAGFQKWQPCLIVAVVLAAVQFIISAVTLIGGAAVGVSAFGMGMLVKDGKLNPAIFGAFFLVILVIVFFTIAANIIANALTAFVYPLISERNLSGGEALMLSVKGGFANIGGLILLMILLSLIAFVGILVCCVGVLFVAPIICAAFFAAYQSVFGRTQSSFQHTPPPPPNFGNQPGY